MTETKTTDEQLSSRKNVDSSLPPGKTAVLGLQHVLVMYAGAVVVPLIVGPAIGLTQSQLAFLIQADLFTCGIATLLQCIGIGRNIGIKLPVMLGVSFTAVAPIIIIGQKLGLQEVYGAIIVSGLVVYLISGHFSKLRKFFPPLVTGSVVTTIGISLLPVAMNWAAGGIGSPDFGSAFNLVLASGVLLIIVLLNRFAKGFIAAIAVLIGIVTGSVIAYYFGHMNIDAIASEPVLSVVTPFWFGLPRLNLIAIVSMIVVGLISMVESTGVFFAVGNMTDTEITKKDIAKGLRAEGLSAVLGGILNSFPYTTFSQNVGLVAITKVKTRYVTAAAGIILIFLGLLPKAAALVAAIPPAVLGGAGVAMFGMVAAAGIHMLSVVDFERAENQFILAISLGLGIGVSVVPGIFDGLPPDLKMLLSNGIVVGTITAVLMNYFLNYRAENGI